MLTTIINWPPLEPTEELMMNNNDGSKNWLRDSQCNEIAAYL